VCFLGVFVFCLVLGFGCLLFVLHGDSSTDYVVHIRCCLNPMEVSFLLFGFVWWRLFAAKRRAISLLQR